MSGQDLVNLFQEIIDRGDQEHINQLHARLAGLVQTMVMEMLQAGNRLEALEAAHEPGDRTLADALSAIRGKATSLETRLQRLEDKQRDGRRDTIQTVLNSLKAAGINPAGCKDCDDDDDAPTLQELWSVIPPDSPAELADRVADEVRGKLCEDLNRLAREYYRLHGTYLVVKFKECKNCPHPQYELVEQDPASHPHGREGSGG